jgi:hypothetical protein
MAGMSREITRIGHGFSKLKILILSSLYTGEGNSNAPFDLREKG